jgi:2-dehydro-3-deoxyphosphogluconate aldolase / (4S)-4-hydroxy-2-oxoglutarate aldolase
MGAVRADRALAVVRADHIPDVAQLCRALAEGGIRTVELTFTTPDVLDHLAAAADVPGVVLGAGTVLTADQTRAAIDAGARFLVTPGLRPAVAEVDVGAGTWSEITQRARTFASALTPDPSGASR